MTRRLTLVAGLALCACLWADTAHAQGAVANFPDQVIQQFTTLAAGWVGAFQGYARNTFNILALISVALVGFRGGEAGTGARG